MKKPLIILAGPTAVGKTALSIELAKRINGEIISADSMQVYRGMDIGTAKIKEDEMDGINHYLIDEFDPDDEFNVHIFQQRAKKYIEEIHNKGKIPIIVGGTGFYIQAVLYDIDFTEGEDKSSHYREELTKILEKEGNLYLHNMLADVDIESAKAIHHNNEKKVIRALEYYMTYKEPISKHNEEQRQKKSPYEYSYFVLTMDREKLYERINYRVDLMFNEGLIEEVKDLKDKGFTKELVSMQGLGYKEVLDYIEGKITLEETKYIIKRDTRHFAKRQLTWFKREKNVKWVDITKFNFDFPSIFEEIIKNIEENEIL
ncbi:tRNA dimethylallyltransferase [Natranaerovirga pectinivora]|uniref:tRNA dimethylallyltransferase n=1 Tax=Natranaerovirga pectinivora TaxID=682400 RepID=A0A4R3MKL2_9FIRM|nr:tRNA (adenosine(37)-N6)-dimethylallyltransferase MiaA [Natranaerovirga pectinivora]TCT14993.1 tRNA dimethylallyltransferase [Natranaerovirga pectinivora]